MPFLGSSIAAPILIGLTTNGVNAVAISSGSTAKFTANYNATVLTDASASLCVDPVAILAGTASGHGNVPVLGTGNGRGRNAGSQLLLRSCVGHTSAPTIGGSLQVGVLGYFPGRSAGQTQLLLPHELYSSSFPDEDPTAGTWEPLFDINGDSPISIPAPSTTVPDMSDTTGSKDSWYGDVVRVPLYGALFIMVVIRGVMTLSAGNGVVIGRIVN